jgi:hypothetical protein
MPLSGGEQQFQPVVVGGQNLADAAPDAVQRELPPGNVSSSSDEILNISRIRGMIRAISS